MLVGRRFCGASNGDYAQDYAALFLHARCASGLHALLSSSLYMRIWIIVSTDLRVVGTATKNVVYQCVCPY